MNKLVRESISFNRKEDPYQAIGVGNKLLMLENELSNLLENLDIKKDLYSYKDSEYGEGFRFSYKTNKSHYEYFISYNQLNNIYYLYSVNQSFPSEEEFEDESLNIVIKKLEKWLREQ